MEDELMVRFGSDRIKNMMQTLGLAEDQPIQSSTFSKALSSAQARVEGNNFDMRKSLLEYDDVMNQQREIMYGRRNEILDNDSIHDTILETIKNNVTDIVKSHIFPEGKLTDDDLNEIVSYVNEKLLKKDIKLDDLKDKTEDEIIDFIYDKIIGEYEDKLKDVPKEIADEFEKVIMLNIVDKYWTEHINTMSHLREGIHLRSYAQNDPLRAYTVEGFDLFDKMMINIDKDVTLLLVRAEIKQNIERKEVSKDKITNDGKDHVKKQATSKKVGRNDPCPCGSGKKYKQCCGK
jgi:preprotein translocase subunit SecA